MSSEVNPALIEIPLSATEILHKCEEFTNPFNRPKSQVRGVGATVLPKGDMICLEFSPAVEGGGVNDGVGGCRQITSKRHYSPSSFGKRAFEDTTLNLGQNPSTTKSVNISGGINPTSGSLEVREIATVSPDGIRRWIKEEIRLQKLRQMNPPPPHY